MRRWYVSATPQLHDCDVPRGGPSPLDHRPRARAPSRSCPPRRGSCRRGSGPPGRSGAPCRRGSGWSAAGRRRRSRRPARGAPRRRGWSSTRPGRGQLGEPLGLPGQHLVGHPLERLAQHDEARRRSRAPRWMLESQPWRRPEPHSTASTTRSRVCTGFTFTQAEPRRPASYGAARFLTTTPSWPRSSTCETNASASSGSASDQPRHQVLLRHQRGQRLEPLGAGGVEQVAAVEVEQVEEVGREVRRPRSSPCGTRSPGTAAAGPGRRGRAPRRRGRSRSPGARARRDHLGQPVGDVLQRAGGDDDLVATAVHLDPDAVELGVDRRPSPPPALSIAASTSVALDASIGSTGRPTSSTNSASASSPPVSAAVATATVEPAIIAARRTAASGHAARSRQPFLHQRVERALPDLAGHDPAQPGLLLGGGAAEQLGRRGSPRPCDPEPDRAAIRSNASCTSQHRQRRLGSRRGQRLHRPPAQRRCAAGAATRRGRTSPSRSPRRSSRRPARTARRTPRSWPCASASPRPRWRWPRRRRATWSAVSFSRRVPVRESRSSRRCQTTPTPRSPPCTTHC